MSSPKYILALTKSLFEGRDYGDDILILQFNPRPTPENRADMVGLLRDPRQNGRHPLPGRERAVILVESGSLFIRLLDGQAALERRLDAVMSFFRVDPEARKQALRVVCRQAPAAWTRFRITPRRPAEPPLLPEDLKNYFLTLGIEIEIDQDAGDSDGRTSNPGDRKP
jgi:hypothetical protein